MYHYTESGLRNVWLHNGFVEVNTEYGKTVAIQDVEGLHRALGAALLRKARLTGAELRFLRKEMKLSQRALATCLGTSEQNVSLWERKGHLPKMADRFVRILYEEKVVGNVKVVALLDRLCEIDHEEHSTLRMRSSEGEWKEAA